MFLVNPNFFKAEHMVIPAAKKVAAGQKWNQYLPGVSMPYGKEDTLEWVFLFEIHLEASRTAMELNRTRRDQSQHLAIYIFSVHNYPHK
jgi:hypothetical protein